MINPHLRTSSSLHESVREEIQKRIKSGAYSPGFPIPSTATPSEEFGVSPITIKRALRDLQALGALIAVAEGDIRQSKGDTCLNSMQAHPRGRT